MHIKRIHEMIEKLTECTLSAINENQSRVGDFAIPDVIDMIKDLACAEKEAREAKEMEKEEEDEKKENEYFLKMLKEEYGDEEGEKRFYDNYRYKSSGRFAPKGKGSYMPRGRRGYEEPPYYHMTPEMMREHDPEYWRDMDRNMGKMYYTPTSGGNSGGQSGNSMSGGNMGGNSGGSTRGYEDGFDEGQRRGYSEGYEQGSRDGESRGRSQGGNRDRREGRSGQSRRSYMETKEMNKGNTPQEKQEKMKELEKYMGELGSDITEMISDASNEEKTMLKSKLQTLVQKIQ